MTILEEIDKLLEIFKEWEKAEKMLRREDPDYQEDELSTKVFNKIANSAADIALRLDVDAYELADKIMNSNPSWSVEDLLTYLKYRIN